MAWWGMTVLLMGAAPAWQPLSVDGGLTAAQVVEVLDFRADEVHGCFAPDGAVPAKRDWMRLQWTVDTAGRVEGYSFRDGKMRNGLALACLGPALKRWTFPASADGGTWIQHDFRPGPGPLRFFSPDDGGLPESSLLPVIEGRREAIDECAHQAMATSELTESEREGRFSVEVLIGKSGSVLSSRVLEVADMAPPPGVLACVAKDARRWVFPPHAQGQRTRWTTQWVTASTNTRVKRLFLRDTLSFEVLSGPVPRSTEGLQRDVIAQVNRAAVPNVRWCYNESIGRNAANEGKVALEWVIGADGLVVSVDVIEDDIRDAELVDCLKTVVKGWRYPQPRGGGNVVVTFPWIFKQAGSRGE